jgi:hypothetical protein
MRDPTSDRRDRESCSMTPFSGRHGRHHEARPNHLKVRGSVTTMFTVGCSDGVWSSPMSRIGWLGRSPDRVADAAVAGCQSLSSPRSVPGVWAGVGAPLSPPESGADLVDVSSPLVTPVFLETSFSPRPGVPPALLSLRPS